MFSFPGNTLICKDEVTPSTLLPLSHIARIPSLNKQILRKLNSRQSGKDCVMLIWLPAGTFGSDLGPFYPLQKGKISPDLG